MQHCAQVVKHVECRARVWGERGISEMPVMSDFMLSSEEIRP